MSRIAKKMEATLREVEDKELPNKSLEELLLRPGSFLITRESVKSVRSTDTGPHGITLWIRSRVKNLRLNCAKEDAAAVAAIVAALGSQ
ncbi:MAG: hypothetical protein O3A87_03310 [Verrucomicrobia bacterium]|nr:hypothetical protein [Verrucomicrobiota bacterium]MDA1005491.1 hypothetical protein [Verrucomicrobiota bacterium]